MKQILRFLLGATLLLGGAATSPGVAEEWEPLGPEDTRVLQLVVHPRDPRVLWAATFTGLFKSVDAGVSWTPAEALIGVPVSSLAVAPSDPGILYGVVPSLLGGIVAVIRSTDGGASWSVALGCPSGGDACQWLGQTHELDVDPRNPQIVYASTDQGLFRSVDGGGAWCTTGRRGFSYALAIDPSNPRVLWAGGEGGVFRSEDRGVTWVPRNEGMERAVIYEITIDPRNPRWIWATAPTSPWVYQTTNGGARWRRGRAGLQGSHGIWSLALSSASGRDLPVVWAGTERGAFRSLDGGAVWTAVPDLLGLRVSALVTHPGRPRTLWAGSSLSSRMEARIGVYRSVDDGATWRFSSRGLFGPFALDLAFDPVAPGTVWLAAGPAGVLRSTDRGTTWTPRNHGLGSSESGAVLDVALDPHDPQTVWIGTNGGVFRSTDGGATWEARSEGLTLPNSTLTAAIDTVRTTSDPTVLYAASAYQLFRSADGGEHWTAIFGGTNDVLVDPRDPDVLIVAFGDIRISRDGGATWEAVPLGTVPQALAMDPRNPDVLYAGGAGGVFRSADSGRTWLQVADPSVAELAVGPTGEVWAGSFTRLHRSPDGVVDWTLVPDPPTLVLELAVDPHDPDGVFAGTTAGVFRLQE